MIIPKILLVEDDYDLRMLFRLALTDAGFNVKEASDGLEAIGFVQMEEFDAVVLDISMPRIDGCSALGTFRMMRNGRSIPVIVVTALSDPEVERRAFEAGAAAYLQKPITADVVIDTVRHHLALASAKASA